jgi:hypothetical protein
MPAPPRKPPLTLNWHIWAIVAVMLAIVLLLAVGVSY